MTFDEILTAVMELLQREGRVAYRVLKRRFSIDDEYVEDLKADLIDAKRLAMLVQRRMEALWLKSQGLPHGQIAQLVNIPKNTLRDYFQLYVDGGVERLKEVASQGPESALQDHSASVEAYCRAHPPATIKEAQNTIETRTGIKRSETPGREFLQKNSLSGGGGSACFPPKPSPTRTRALWRKSWSRA
jgi:transposase